MWRGNKQRQRRQPRAAFTLIEILCVVVILGIASAIVVPNLGTRSDLIASSATREIMGDLMYAQNQAILNQSMVYATFDATNQKYALTTTAPGTTPVSYVANPVTGTSFQTSFQTGQFKAVSLQTVSCDGKACLAFDELGQPYSVDTSGNANLLVNTATIPVKCGNFTLTVTVEPYTGAMNVQ